MTENSNGVAILIFLLNFLVYKLQKLQEAHHKKSSPLSAAPHSCRRFSLLDIKSATNSFDENLVIGKGGFGIVYKGIIDFGQRHVAIKRAKSTSKQRSREFLTEIEMLSKSQHSHVVSLVGYCDDDEEMILVYEFMPSGSLADHLHKRVRKGDSSLPCLTWEQRLKICIGAAHGLNYLHTGTGIENRVIHRDVKTSNILLDENLAAKISDFGLSKTGPANQTCTYVSTRVRGTHGYLDPYYVATDRVTSKSDVYAFGVVLFEALCGRPAVDAGLEEEQISLAGWAQHCSKEGVLEQIIDQNIKGSISSDSLNVYVDIAVKCLHNQPKLRPTMAEVVVGLQSALALQEKSTHYSLVEIMPDDYSQEDWDPTTVDMKNTDHNREHDSKRDKTLKVSNYWRRNKQSSSRMTFTKRFSALLSVTARAFSVNKDAKMSYSNGVLSENINKSQTSNRLSSVHKPVPLTPRGQEVLQSSKLKRFELNDLREATRNFSSDSVLGEGGFGRVFKGYIDENTFTPSKWGTGLVIAVKRLNLDGSQGHQEWLAEINFLGTLTHPNLVKCIGYCLKEEHRLLVYEFVPRGSLEVHLFRRNPKCPPLSWAFRMRVALGAAKGLAYLHSSLAGVIHRDFKTSNILIDSNYDAKLSDFGIAKDGPDYGDTHVSTMILGTSGYAAPEYVVTGHLSYKSDIYGFGVVLLEIITGRRVVDRNRPREERILVEWAKPYLSSKHKVLHVMDPDIKGQYTEREALRASSLALKCLSGATKSRPDANQLVKELEQLQDVKISGNN